MRCTGCYKPGIEQAAAGPAGSRAGGGRPWPPVHAQERQCRAASTTSVQLSLCKPGPCTPLLSSSLRCPAGSANLTPRRRRALGAEPRSWNGLHALSQAAAQPRTLRGAGLPRECEEGVTFRSKTPLSLRPRKQRPPSAAQRPLLGPRRGAREGRGRTGPPQGPRSRRASAPHLAAPPRPQNAGSTASPPVILNTLFYHQGNACSKNGFRRPPCSEHFLMAASGLPNTTSGFF